MDDAKLLEAIKKAELLDETASNRLWKDVTLSGSSLEELVHERRLIDDEKIAQIKSSILKIPYQKINFAEFDQKLTEIVPEETVKTYKVVPIKKDNNLLVIGMVDPDDFKAQEALKFVGRREHLNLGVYLISYSDWQEVLSKYSPYKAQVQEAVKSLSLKLKEGGRRLVELEATSKAPGEEAPIIRLVADTLKQAVQVQASDVHIEPQRDYLRIRFRINGELHEEATLPVELSQPVVSRVKVISDLKIDENRMPQDGRFRSRILDREVDFRVSTFPTALGEKIAIRVLDPTTGLKNLDQLGLAGRNMERINAGLDKPFGLILITGPTGSGKTTTIYALLQILNKESVNIVSLEDPVEYSMSGLNQSQVRPEIGYDFASGLREILRQDPDVILVGEIRDNETAGLAIHSALTGHIVLSTLHTNNAVGSIPRLIDMKVEPFLIPASLNLVIGQRLVLSLCGNCKKAEEASGPIQNIIAKTLADLPKDLAVEYKPPYKTYHSEGCSKCHGRGVTGRIALFEVFSMTKELEEVIGSGQATVSKIVSETKRQGMITLRQDGVLKALAGAVSIEEVIRETEEA